MRERADGRRLRRAIGPVAVAVASFLSVAATRAQDPSPPGEAVAPPTATVVEAPAVPLSDVTAAAISGRGALRGLREDLQPVAPVLEIEKALEEARSSLERDEARARHILAGQPSGENLKELEAAWSARRRQIDQWGVVLQARSRALQENLDELARMQTVWAKTLRQAQEEQAPQVILSRIAEIRKEVGETAADTKRRQREILTVQEKVGVQRADADAILGDVRRAQTLFVSRLFDPQGPPIWKWFGRRSGAEQVATEARDSLLEQIDAIVTYLRGHWSDVLLQVLAAAIVAAFLYRGRKRAAKWAEEDPALESVSRAFSVPFSMAALLLVFLLGWTNPLAPPALLELLGLLALIPAVRLLKRLVPPRLFVGVYGLAAFSVIDRFRSLLYASPRVEWLVFLVEMVAALLLTLLIFSPERIGDIGWARDDWKRRFMLAARKLLIALFAVAIVATSLGYARLGSLLGDGIIGSAYVAIVIYAVAETFTGLWAYLLRSRLASSLRFVRNHRWLLQRRGQRVVSTLFFAGWVIATLRAFSLLSVTWEALSAVFGARFERGNVSISLGDVVLFGVSVWAALMLSRFIRFILEEDVYARVRLAHGASYAVSTLLHYFLIIGGFLIGISVIGFDMSRFAIVAGALGVGIGFGLQNIVNNFVSGLILLFERPIQVGDAVEVGTLSGEVRRIGIRASTIRTWNGAELIVPNGTLIAETVTNWTLSDRMRRIEIPVGVAYGTDPETVMRILGEVARANSNVVSSPEVTVLFVGFGDSSLDFEVRAWTARFENWLGVRSELMVAITRALQQAGIEIPFPQRDLHLRSFDEEAARRLHAGQETNPPETQTDTEKS